MGLLRFGKDEKFVVTEPDVDFTVRAREREHGCVVSFKGNETFLENANLVPVFDANDRVIGWTVLPGVTDSMH